MSGSFPLRRTQHRGDSGQGCEAAAAVVAAAGTAIAAAEGAAVAASAGAAIAAAEGTAIAAAEGTAVVARAAASEAACLSSSGRPRWAARSNCSEFCIYINHPPTKAAARHPTIAMICMGFTAWSLPVRIGNKGVPHVPLHPSFIRVYQSPRPDRSSGMLRFTRRRGPL
ncbi:MAG: hypothetical protein EXR76_08170 [Myxococcales bacterium]|nr:hypothetical protein [Myxococcales bacterium]